MYTDRTPSVRMACESTAALFLKDMACIRVLTKSKGCPEGNGVRGSCAGGGGSQHAARLCPGVAP